MPAGRKSFFREQFASPLREGLVTDNYVWAEDDVLGKGSFGTVYEARSKLDAKRHVAIKQLGRDDIPDPSALWEEISILNELDHPNVLRFIEAFEDFRNYYIVTELCLGGDLMGWLPEVVGNMPFARRVTREVAGALAHCHAKRVCHRDLKMGNILLLRDHISSPVRIADFGVAKHSGQRIKRGTLGTVPSCMPGNSSRRATLVRMNSFKGTPEFMAPEVIKCLQASLTQQGGAFYDTRCDVWSLGVCAHALLLGGLPFSLEDISAFVEEGTAMPAFGAGAELHPPAMRFLERCFVTDFHQRASMRDLTSDAWLQEPDEPGTADSAATEDSPTSIARTPASGSQPGSPISKKQAKQLASRFVAFGDASTFKRAALTAAAKHISAYEQEELRDLFQRIDTDNSGTVSTEELRNALQEVTGDFVTDAIGGSSWAEHLLRCVDTDRSGEIDYTEFLAAAMDHCLEDHKDLAWAAFRCLDLDGDGVITVDELRVVFDDKNVAKLMAMMKPTEAERVRSDMDEVASSGRDEIKFEDFLRLLRLS